jgi:hypothetical protein
MERYASVIMFNLLFRVLFILVFLQAASALFFKAQFSLFNC